MRSNERRINSRKCTRGCKGKLVNVLTMIKKMLIRTALPAALSLALAPAPAVIGPGAEAATVSTTIRVRAVVLAHADLIILKQPAELVVTDADVRRGYVELDGASVIELKNNTRAGCLLSVSARGLPFQETSIDIMGRTVVLGPDGGLVTLPVMGRTIVALSYRFVLSKGTQPGTYAWPFSLSVSPL